MRHQSKNRWEQWIVSALAFGILMPAAQARIDIVANVWEYFEFFNLSRFYDHYSTIIDLLIYTLLFTGLVRVALERRFPGKGGKAIAVGLGFILGVAMTIAGEAYGFSIKSFGPLAVSFLALLIGITLYRILLSGGVRRSRAGPLAFLILFVVMMAIAPELFGWFNDYAPMANVLLLIGFLLSLGALGVSLVSGGLRSTQRLERDIDRSMRDSRRDRWGRENSSGNDNGSKGISSEAKILKRAARPEARKASKAGSAVMGGLKSVAKDIREHGNNPNMRESILRKMRSVAPDGEKLRESIQRLRSFSEKLSRFDESLFRRKSREAYSRMEPRARRLLKAEIQNEGERMDLEKKAIRLETALKGDLEEVFRQVQTAAAHLRSGRANEAWLAVRKAIKAEKSLMDLARLLEILENYLIHLTKADVRIRKRLDHLA